MTIDPRIVRVGIEVDGELKVYENLAIVATGMKYANANQNEIELTIFNLDKVTRDYILTQTSPFNQNKTPKRLILEVGRESYGAFKLFQGDITSSVITQPPDIGLKVKALTANFAKGNIIARNQPAQVDLSVASQQVAKDLGVSLDFQATNKKVSNYSFTGGALKQVDKLGEMGAVDAYIDDGVLVVKDYNVPLTGRLRRLNLDSGMIGIPEFTEQGIKVQFLIDNQTAIGSGLEITSVINPAVNGTYIIYKLGFEVASRDTPFYYTAEALRRE